MNLSNINLAELQSGYMKNDPITMAMCEALNPYMLDVYKDLELCLIYSRIDELGDNTLDELAWQFSVDSYDVSMQLEKKRILIKEALKLHRLKGTPQGLLNVITTIFGRTKLEEWFEYGGEPYFFRLNIDISEQGASKENLEKLDDLIKKYKNVRSWVDVLNIFLTNHGKVFCGAATISGEEIVIYPWSPRSIESRGKINIAMANSGGVENITLYPKKKEG